MAENHESMQHTIAIAKHNGTAARDDSVRARLWSAVIPCVMVSFSVGADPGASVMMIGQAG